MPGTYTTDRQATINERKGEKGKERPARKTIPLFRNLSFYHSFDHSTVHSLFLTFSTFSSLSYSYIISHTSTIKVKLWPSERWPPVPRRRETPPTNAKNLQSLNHQQSTKKKKNRQPNRIANPHHHPLPRLLNHHHAPVQPHP